MSKSLGIVVGVDGSEPAQEALEWALEEARLRGSRVTAVHGWDYNYYPAGVMVQAGKLEQESRKMLDQAVDPWREKYSDISIDTRLTQASSGAAALKEASQEADLVVVGSRGHGAVVSTLLGSVSSSIVHHAHCPVVVIRGE